ncbi:sugar phosphate isomerase/epimerase family protein [Pacificoceanicola onchidii]|uniref:sugar phosphate isomerase/epimerase family protein n=1 Tax=Pacificoceanicola onchidii TaxID=2562685 RepID=UPI0010A685E3|nr:TIM barrel protein [Pacificoceanicola onchidii]
MTLFLSLSCNPLLNRIANPADLVETCARDIGIKRIQMTNEVINPSWPANTIKRLTDEFTKSAAANDLRATSVMTSGYTRINNMGHPDPDVRQWTFDWMARLGEIAADVGADSVGSQFAILTWQDYDDPARREVLIEAALDGWEQVWERCDRAGLKYIYWETMSVGREFGHTIASAHELNQKIKARGLPFKLLLDVDHGDLQSENPDDTDPYKWIEALAVDSPIIHIKQSHAVNKSGHNPFIEPFNSEGRIHAAELVPALEAHGPCDMEVCLELSFREREPTDSRAHVVDALRRSVDYWRPHIQI